MSTSDQSISTVEEFDAFVMRDRNRDRNFEYIGGEVIEREAALDIEEAVAAELVGRLFMHLQAVDTGWLFGGMCGYRVMDERYIPNISYLSYARYPELTGAFYNPTSPDLAVEMMSEQRPLELDLLPVKLQNYMAAGTVAWVVFAEHQQIEVYEPGMEVLVLRTGDTLSGAPVLPDLSIDVDDIFAVIKE